MPTNNPVPKTALSAIVKKLDRLVDKLNDNNVIVASSIYDDPYSWRVRATFRTGGSVMRVLSEDGRRVCSDSETPDIARFPVMVGGVRSITTVDIHSYQGIVGYSIHNNGDACSRAARKICVAAPSSRASLHELRGEWLIQLFPESVYEDSEARYTFSKVDAHTFLASLVTCKHTYREIAELITRYFDVKLKQNFKLIGG